MNLAEGIIKDERAIPLFTNISDEPVKSPFSLHFFLLPFDFSLRAKG